MSLAIYTYKDPYRLESEPYWNEIKTCPYFCVSQTLVNGLKYVYKSDFQQGRVTTVQNLIEALYEYWTSTACAVKQHTDIDNIISHNISTLLNGSLQQNMASAFLFNREEVFESLRIMFELNINLQDVVEEKLTPEQKFIVEIYRIISNSGVIADFTIDEKHSIEEIDKSISSAMAKAAEYAGNEIDLSKIQNDRIVRSEMSYRGLSLSPEEVLKDTIKGSLCIASRGQVNKEDYTYYKDGISRIRNHILGGKFSGDIAGAYASRVLYLTSSMYVGRDSATRINDASAYSNQRIDLPKPKSFSYLRIVDPIAYGYAVEAGKLLKGADLS